MGFESVQCCEPVREGCSVFCLTSRLREWGTVSGRKQEKERRQNSKVADRQSSWNLFLVLVPYTAAPFDLGSFSIGLHVISPSSYY